MRRKSDRAWLLIETCRCSPAECSGELEKQRGLLDFALQRVRATRAQAAASPVCDSLKITNSESEEWSARVETVVVQQHNGAPLRWQQPRSRAFPHDRGGVQDSDLESVTWKVLVSVIETSRVAPLLCCAPQRRYDREAQPNDAEHGPFETPNQAVRREVANTAGSLKGRPARPVTP